MGKQLGRVRQHLVLGLIFLKFISEAFANPAAKEVLRYRQALRVGFEQVRASTRRPEFSDRDSTAPDRTLANKVAWANSRYSTTTAVPLADTMSIPFPFPSTS